jgi:hypothetical protein
VFPNIRSHFKDHKWLCERVILAPKNNSVNAINSSLEKLHLKSRVIQLRMSTRRFSILLNFSILSNLLGCRHTTCCSKLVVPLCF